MDALAFLTWTRGPGLNLALLIFVLGTLWRLIEIYGLGRKQEKLAGVVGVGAADDGHGAGVARAFLLPDAGVVQRSEGDDVGLVAVFPEAFDFANLDPRQGAEFANGVARVGDREGRDIELRSCSGSDGHGR